MQPLWAFLKLSRPHFLVGGAVMFAVGASRAPDIDVGHYLLAQAMVTAGQVTAHFVNEYADVEPDKLVTNRTIFSGGSGVLPAGSLAPSVALRAAVVSSLGTAALAAAVATFSPQAAALGLTALAVSWLYSMPPVRLLDTGWGELVTSLVVVGVVPAIGVLANAGTVGAELLWVVAVLLPVHMAMMLAFELPDLETDRAAGKTVLAVRMGAIAATRLMAGLWVMAAVILVTAVTADRLDASWVAAAAAVPALAGSAAAARGLHSVTTTAAVVALVALAISLIA